MRGEDPIKKSESQHASSVEILRLERQAFVWQSDELKSPE